MRRAPKRKSSPTNSQRVCSCSTKRCEMNTSADVSAKALLKRSTITSSIPALSSNSNFSRKVVRRAGASSGEKNSRGCGSKVIAAVGRPSCCAAVDRACNMAWCPRWTPSKLPMVRARGPIAEAGIPKWMRMNRPGKKEILPQIQPVPPASWRLLQYPKGLTVRFLR